MDAMTNKWTTRVERERAFERMIERSAVSGVAHDWHQKDAVILRDCIPIKRADYEELARIREQRFAALYPEQSPTVTFKQEHVGEWPAENKGTESGAELPELSLGSIRDSFRALKVLACEHIPGDAVIIKNGKINVFAIAEMEKELQRYKQVVYAAMCDAGFGHYAYVQNRAALWRDIGFAEYVENAGNGLRLCWTETAKEFAKQIGS